MRVSPTEYGRKIIMEHEGLEGLAHQGLDFLFIRGGPQGGDGQGLGFAPGEDRRAMGAAQQADFPGNGPDRR